ncbi:rhodopsin kinase GRK7 isoform X2 [Carettochelys insculpta]|uniref:rhodopsin kinase GRK7 isoform X2 n=1 Tax=Carettochelys insculpta TaxID=44489 RepID=UPI003EC11AFA
MCDMGGLDNLIANTAYLQARKSTDGDLKEMQRRRKSLSLPKPEQCTEVRKALLADYESICEQQPIGKRFFRDFLETMPEYLVAKDFLDEVSNWELAEDNAKSSIMQGLVTNFLKSGSKSYLAFMSSSLASKCQAATEKDYESIIQQAKEETKAFLQGKPFQDFQKTSFYDKFLQWKVFEKQPVTEKYFYEFRVLGKGGFGEVCAIQVKTTGKMYACKKLDKKRLKKKGGESMALLEKEILEKINSPFIVTLAYAYETKSHLCLVMSLMNGGDLKYHIYNVGERGLEMNRIIFYSAQITCGILHLHSINILYRDMKPENVLLDDNGNCRLSDLGLAVKVKEGRSINQRWDADTQQQEKGRGSRQQLPAAPSHPAHLSAAPRGGFPEPPAQPLHVAGVGLCLGAAAAACPGPASGCGLPSTPARHGCWARSPSWRRPCHSPPTLHSCTLGTACHLQRSFAFSASATTAGASPLRSPTRVRHYPSPTGGPLCLPSSPRSQPLAPPPPRAI